MSQKWIRSKKWDDEHIPGWAWPAKAVLRAFSSIPLAVVLLTGVSAYGTLASVPIGLIALAPTYMIYGLTLVLVMGAAAVAPMLLLTGGMRKRGASRAARFAVGFFGMIGLSVVSIWAWHRFAWPMMRYDELTGNGLRLFKGFVAENKSITVRRLPGMEMSELEFYAWWPLKVMLIAFVVNMVTATVRRIEFIFPNIGVLTVHSGIVTLALGSMYYSSLKEEGDMLLESGAVDGAGQPTPGPPVSGFYDNTDVALWVSEGTSWRQLALRGVPRYHDYNLNALGIEGMTQWAREFDEGRTLRVKAKSASVGEGGKGSDLPASLRSVGFNLVGYSPYATVGQQWVPASPAEVAGLKAPSLPARNFEIVVQGGVQGGGSGAGEARVTDRTQLFPTIPAGRVQPIGLGMMLEYTSGMAAERWSDLNTAVEPGAMHTLIVEVPDPIKPDAPAVRTAVTLSDQSRHTIGASGYQIETVRLVPSLRQLLEESANLPVGIDDPLYTGADTSVAVIKISPPASKGQEPYVRFVYHRYPEQSIDIFQTSANANDPTTRGGLGKRKAEGAIRLSYLDDSVPQYYVDEVVSESTDAGNPVLRGVMRARGGGVDGKPTVLGGLKPGFVISLGPMAGMRIAERWAHAIGVEYPVPVPAGQRDNKELGTHRHAALAVEVEQGEWKQTVWLPFSQYALTEQQNARGVDLPDGTRLMLAFGRVMRTLPDLQIQLADFKMFSHDFGGPTQDFRSDVVVLRGSGEKQTIDVRYTSLNDPLLVRVPFRAREDAPAVAKVLGRLVSVIAPTQYKFSQAGWDPEGWNATQAEVDQGKRARALARWTILGVGNNPGIYVIAAGAIMMVVGIPWAFYVKPYIVRRRKLKVQAGLTRTKPERSIPTGSGSEA